jgi:subtilase family serine protease
MKIIRHSRKLAHLSTALMVVAAIAMLADLPSGFAQEAKAVVGNHVGSAAAMYHSELPDAQVLDLEVVMALNNRDQLNQLQAELQNPDSPNYRKWLTPDDFADRFGPTPAQMQAVANWLTGEGLQVTAIDPISRTVRFSATYSQVKAVLQTRITTDGHDYANVSDPQVPAELAPTIVSIEGLTSQEPLANGGNTDAIVSSCTSASGDPPCNTLPFFGPGDLYTFYDEIPVLSGGNLGTGGAGSPADCIAMPENGSVNPQALTNFVTQFTGLPSQLPSGLLPPIALTTVVPTVAGVTPQPPGLPSDNEPYLDIEWSHAVSPNTPIRVYYSNESYLAAMQSAVDENMCGVITSSVESNCPPVTTILALDDVEAQAVAQGQTVFHSSGDYGSNWHCGSPIPAMIAQPSATPTPIPQAPYKQSKCSTVSGSGYTDSKNRLWQPSIDEQAASPNVTSVGGTQFKPVYDDAGNDLSTVSQGLEQAWNNQDPEPKKQKAKSKKCPIKDSSGGGPSVLFPKPAWQAGVGVPPDGARDIPDVAMGANGSLVAAGGEGNLPGFFVATQKSTDPAPTFNITGGTSIASPMWAGVSRLIAQAQGVTRLGNINQRLYELGNLQSLSSGLHDITEGNNSDGGIAGYSAGPGFDLATGWGSPDIAKLVAAFPGAAATTTPVTTNVSAGQTAAAGTITVTNTTSGPLNLSSVTVNLSDSAIFTSLTLSATVASVPTQVVAAVPAPTSVFTFSSAVVIPSGGFATLVLQGGTALATAPPSSASSNQTLGQGSIVVGDGQGGNIQVSGLPATLGSVTVQY